MKIFLYHVVARRASCKEAISKKPCLAIYQEIASPPKSKSGGSQRHHGVAVTPGVCERVGVRDAVGVRVGVDVLVAVGVRDAVGVDEGVDVGRAVGASPCRRNRPTTFQFNPTKIWTS